MIKDIYICLLLASVSGVAIGTSFVVTKKALLQAKNNHGFDGNGFAYLKNPVWWAGTGTLVIGEICNFAALAFVPATLVTPLGALSVIVGAVLGSYVLNESLGTMGKLGISCCLLGAVNIVLHAPPDKEINTVDQILSYAAQPAFVMFVAVAVAVVSFLIYKIVPLHGQTNALVYLTICSLMGALSVMCVKAFSVALRLTLSGKNQFTHISTYLFMILSAACVVMQMNYFNKALTAFPSNIVNPLYYVTFTTTTLCVNFTLYGGLEATDLVGILSLVCGLLTTFAGIFLLQLSHQHTSHEPEAYPEYHSLPLQDYARHTE